MYGFADQEEPALIMMMNFMFLEGEFNGSTLNVMGRDAMSDSARELAVVGGTGAFRFAKGYVQLKTVTFDQKSGDAVVLFNVFVNHASTSFKIESDNGGSTGSSTSDGAPLSSQASLSLMVSSFSFIIISLLYLCIF